MTNLFSSFFILTGKNKPMVEKVLSSKALAKLDLVFAQSPKGREILIHDGHKYVVNVKMRDKTTWRCNSATKYGCRCSASTSGNEFKMIKDHNHPRENFPVQVVKMKSNQSPTNVPIKKEKKWSTCVWCLKLKPMFKWINCSESQGIQTMNYTLRNHNFYWIF